VTHEGAVRAWGTRRRNLSLKPIIRAISIRQPYAEMILCGEKREEYRSRPTLIKGRVYLCAALRPGDASDWQRLTKRPGDLPTGKIIGTVEIAGCHWDESRGCFAYALQNPQRLQRPLLPKNQPQPCFWIPHF
jgi:hypothetical protein